MKRSELKRYELQSCKFNDFTRVVPFAFLGQASHQAG